ncbi:hypothetical protein [Microcoleus sp. bin38.metabat.b11b12b14.051]|uniref:hypothetical protein n=1 Tax=Microcoleus sp. bin38.metabat.b11b12b14.051 TaxID=2742709 RepID=UPI0025E49380|nr:hypothetical protein [Microcoleus sp. bin38.metabat.b11b12b14.051]
MNYHKNHRKNQVFRPRHSILTKTLFLWSIASFSCITTLLWGQSVALSQQPVCPTGDAANFPSPPLSQTEKSTPSLWLAQKQFGGKLLDRWFVDRTNTWVIIIVNRQLWSLLDYMERYQFVNRFGAASNEYGYNLRVCNRQGTALAVYACKGDRQSCKIDLESLSNPGLRGKLKGF